MGKLSGSRVAGAGALLVFVSLAVLAWLSTRNGLYFDDEIFTIRLLESKATVGGVIRAVNSGDLHPPLSYAIEFLLHRLTGDWKSVQLIGGIANALALAVFAGMAHRAMPRGAWWVLTGLLATFASAIMWGASLRWYAWFNPCFAIALATVLWGRLKPLATLAVLAGLGAVMFHTGYLAMIACPLLGLLWLWRYRHELDRGMALRAAVILLVAAVACMPQMLVLWRVHLAYPVETQVGSFIVALAQTGLTVVLGNAVFPLNPLALITLAMFGAVLLRSLVKLRRNDGLAALWPVVALGCAFMVLSGLGLKARSSLFLTIALLPLLATALADLKLSLRIPALLLTGVFTLQGMTNVALHQGTDKRSFNTPHREIIASSEAMAGRCQMATVVNFDEVTAFALPRHLHQVDRLKGVDRQFEAGECLILALGSASDCAQEVTPRWQSALGQASVSLVARRQFAPEPYRSRAARFLGKTIEDHAAVVSLYRVTRPTRVTVPYPAYTKQGLPACAPAQAPL